METRKNITYKTFSTHTMESMDGTANMDCVGGAGKQVVEVVESPICGKKLSMDGFWKLKWAGSRRPDKSVSYRSYISYKSDKISTNECYTRLGWAYVISCKNDITMIFHN